MADIGYQLVCLEDWHHMHGQGWPSQVVTEVLNSGTGASGIFKRQQSAVEFDPPVVGFQFFLPLGGQY